MRKLLFLCWAFSLASGAGIVSAEPGLVATYTDGERTVVRVVPTPHLYVQAGDSIHPQIAPGFQATWRGVLKIQRAGRYKLHADADVQLLGNPADDWIQLPTGEHPLMIRFSRKAGQVARLQLQWESEFFRREPVPSEALAHHEAPQQLLASDAVERGRYLFAELGCANCHAATNWQLQSRRGPDLTNAGSRLYPGWVYHWLKSPRSYRKSAVMPVCLDSDWDRSDVTAFLASLGNQPTAAEEKPLAEQMQLGQDTFERVGCQNCHDKDNDLEQVGLKYVSVAHLADFIAQPHQRDPQGRMPRLFPTEDRHLATAVATFLFHTKRQNPSTYTPAPAGDPVRGAELFASHGCANCHAVDSPKIAEQSRLAAPAFSQPSGLPLKQHWDFDDGVVERIAGKQEKVVGRTKLSDGRAGKAFDFDGKSYVELAHFHRPATMTISVWIKTTQGGSILTWGRPGGGRRGSRELRMNIGQDGRNSVCYGEYNSDGGWRPVIVRPTAVNLVDGQWHHLAVVRQDQMIQHYIDGKPQGKPGKSQPDSGDYTDRLLIGALGLQANPSNRFRGLIDDLSVWEMALSAEQIASLAEGLSPLDLATPEDVEIKPFDVASGCLADEVQRPLPDYQLQEADRQALQQFLATVQPDQPSYRAPLAQHELLIQQFRCTACHQLDAENIQRATKVTDDGRIVQVERPPILTGVGVKLTTSRLHEVLLNGKRNRPWLNLRMPHFGPSLASLPNSFTAVAGMAPHDASPKPDKDLAAAGLKLIGQQRGKASCITCHNYRGINRRKDGVVPAPDLAEAGSTVRPDWFQRWMHDPQRLQPGTSMPQFFLDVSPEERQLNIDRLWSAIYFQNELPLPDGVLTQQTEGTRIVVKDKPVMFRMATATPVGKIDRAINVGIPGGFNYTFDPVACQLKYAWKGEFIDAGPAWNGRGGNPVRAGNPPIVAIKSGHSLHIGNVERQVKFLGYRLQDDLPIFRYLLNDAVVEHEITVSANGVVQLFHVRGAKDEVVYQGSPDIPSRTTVLEKQGDVVRLEVESRRQ